MAKRAKYMEDYTLVHRYLTGDTEAGYILYANILVLLEILFISQLAQIF